ncbi:MAG: glycoside hydrolase family 127 protein, partial [Terriglobales bacterium]
VVAAALPAWGATRRAAQAAPARRGMRERISVLAEPFPLAQVRLLESPFSAPAATNNAYLQSLGPERLLHMFRLTAGLASTAEPLGGWEAPDCELRGHFTGHFLSSAGLRYAATGDAAAKAHGDEIVAGLAACQKANRNGYISAFPESFFDRLANDKQVWAPFYTLHKIMAGCLDMHTHAGNAQALEVASGMSDWVGHWLKGMGDDQLQRILRTEFGGMSESLWNLAAITGDYNAAASARRFEKTTFLDPLAAHRDALQGLHVNTHIPQVIAAARRYELTGDPRYHGIADYFWHEVVGERSYVSGGTSNGEYWDTAPGQLGKALSRYTQECCCGYNMLKLTRHLYTWTADPRYFDYYERTLWNSRLGTEHLGDGGKMYYFPLQTGWWKYLSSPTNSFWCCDGTGAEEFSKFANSIYFHSGSSLFVNLFIASELRWPQHGLSLRQQTRFPDEPSTRIEITASQPVRLAIHLRIPSWTAAGASASVNGRRLEAFASPGSYLVIEREWRGGDTIDLALPMALYAEALKGDANQQAVLYGPLALAARIEGAALTRTQQFDVDSGPTQLAARVPRGTSPAPLRAPRPTPAGRFGGGRAFAPAEPAAWIEKGQGLSFHTRGAEAIELAPLYQVMGERYGVYWLMS